MSRRGKSTETESRLAVARGWELGTGESLLLGTGFPLGMMRLSQTYIALTVAHAVNTLKRIALYTFRGVNYISVTMLKKKKKERRVQVPGRYLQLEAVS